MSASSVIGGCSPRSLGRGDTSRTLSSLADDARKRAIASLRSYSAENFDDELSELKAMLLRDHILDERAADIEAARHKSEFPVSGTRKR